jgi:hypothetical protein
MKNDTLSIKETETDISQEFYPQPKPSRKEKKQPKKDDKKTKA